MARATSSFPTPLSPSIRTANGAPAARVTARRTSSIARLTPTSSGIDVDATATSRATDCSESTRVERIAAASSRTSPEWLGGVRSTGHLAHSAPSSRAPRRMGTPISAPALCTSGPIGIPASRIRAPTFVATPDPALITAVAGPASDEHSSTRLVCNDSAAKAITFPMASRSFSCSCAIATIAARFRSTTRRGRTAESWRPVRRRPIASRRSGGVAGCTRRRYAARDRPLRVVPPVDRHRAGADARASVAMASARIASPDADAACAPRPMRDRQLAMSTRVCADSASTRIKPRFGVSPRSSSSRAR